MRSTVTYEGMIQSQPGTCVSVTSPVDGRSRLNVSRMYNDLTNEWGGKGKFKKCDCDGMMFNTSQEAFDYAFKRGYTREYYSSPTLRAKRVKEGEKRKQEALSWKKQCGTMVQR